MLFLLINTKVYNIQNLGVAKSAVLVAKINPAAKQQEQNRKICAH